MGFWKNVENECNYRGISRKELAAAVHFSVNTISSGIKRNGMPEADLALRISKVLNVPLEQLLPQQQIDITPIDSNTFVQNHQLFTNYLQYVQKIEKLPPQTKKSLLALIDSL